MGFLQLVNDYASAIGVLFAVISGVSVIVVFIWRLASRYQNIEHNLTNLETVCKSLDSTITTRISTLQERIDERLRNVAAETSLRFDNIDEKMDSVSSQMIDTSDELRSLGDEIKIMKDEMSENSTRIAILESHMGRLD